MSNDIDPPTPDGVLAYILNELIKPAGSWTFDVLKEWLKTEILQGLPTIRRLGE